MVNEDMLRTPDAARRLSLKGRGILATAILAGVVPATIAGAHEGHDHAPRAILDLMGTLVRIMAPGEDVGDEVVEDRVTIRVDAEGRIADLSNG